MVKRLIIWVVFSCFLTTSYTQQMNADSLKTLLEGKDTQDTAYIDILNHLALIFQRTNLEKSLQYAEKADSLSDLLDYNYGKAESNRLMGLYFLRNTDYAVAYQLFYSALELFIKENNLLGIVNCKNSLGAIYSYQGNFDKALEIFNTSLIACEESGETNLMTLAYNNIGNIYYFQGNLDEAIENYEKALIIRKEINDKIGLAASYNNIGAIYQAQGDYPKALENFQKTKKYSEELEDNRTLAMSLNNIGVIYEMQGEYDEAMAYYYDALEIREKVNDKKGIATGYNNIGGIFKAKNDFESALIYYQKSLEIKKETGYIKEMPLSYNNIANVYLEMKEFDNAFEFFTKALELSKEIGLKSTKAWSIIGLAEIYLEKNNIQQAYRNSKSALEIANEVGDIKLLQKSAEILSKSSARLNLFEDAYKFHVIYKDISDSIRSEENIRKIVGLEFEYKYAKEKEIAQLEREKVEALHREAIFRERNIRNSFILGSVFLAVLVFLLLFAFIQRRKANRLLAVKKSLEFKQNFLANMSHEIRTPLTGLIGMIDVISRTNLDKKQSDYLGILQQSADNLYKVINQILDYSKIEAGKINLNLSEFQVDEILENAKNLFNSICNKDIKFEIHIDESVPENIIADKTRINQIVNNLVLNAIKFTDEGSIEVLVSVKGFENIANRVILKIEVKDTGLGIDKDKHEQIFVPFGQIDQCDIRNYDGVGLGLSICKELVKMHEGEIGFESEYNEGSTFWFTFKADIPNNTEQKELFPGFADFETLKPLNILFVEDKETTRKVVNLLLSSMGHSVSLANNGMHALEVFSPGKFDLILMDIKMPEMDGITAVQELREKYDDLPPIVGLSANAFEGAREKYMKEGLDEYIAKPLIMEDFVEVVKKVL